MSPLSRLSLICFTVKVWLGEAALVPTPTLTMCRCGCSVVTQTIRWVTIKSSPFGRSMSGRPTGKLMPWKLACHGREHCPEELPRDRVVAVSARPVAHASGAADSLGNQPPCAPTEGPVPSSPDLGRPISYSPVVPDRLTRPSDTGSELRQHNGPVDGSRAPMGLATQNCNPG